MIEYEKTYLAKYLPQDLTDYHAEEIVDLYIPADAASPTLRLRKQGKHYDLTKKEIIHEGDFSEMHEYTIHLSEKEYEAFKSIPTKEIRKIRYFYPFKDHIAEISIFKKALAGLVLIDFEFEKPEEKNEFKMPEFCLADVTQESFASGRNLAGKSYSDIEEELKQFDYHELILK